MEELNLEGILDDESMLAFTESDLDKLNLNSDEEKIEDSNESNEEDDLEDSSNNKETNKATENQLNEIFRDSESVGSEEDLEGNEDVTPSNSDSSSPKNADFFSSIAGAFAEEGILPDLNEDKIKNIKTAEDFRKVITEYIQSELTEQQQRVTEALNNGVNVGVVQQYEKLLEGLTSISEEALSQETENAEEARKNFIFQDFVNRGFSKERAAKEVEKSLRNGTDIEDAKEALKSNIEYYQVLYKNAVDQAKAKRASEEAVIKQRATNLKKTLLDDSQKFFGDIDVDRNTRQKIFDNIAKPIYKDPNSGDYLTAVQKYEQENPDDFVVKMGLFYTLTDGFKSIDKLVNAKVKKGIKKGLANLESVLNNTARDSFGNLDFVSNDGNSYIGKGLKIDV